MTASHDADRLLAAWLEHEAPGDVPPSLLEAVAAKARVTRQRPGWAVRLAGAGSGAVPRTAPLMPRFGMVMLLVALVALAVAGALIGAQLTRRQPPVSNADPDAVADAATCGLAQSYLPDDAVLGYERRRIRGGAQEFLTIYRDGRVVTGPPLAVPGQETYVRRLSPEGVRLVVDAALEERLFGRCWTERYAELPFGAVTVATEQGIVFGGWGPGAAEGLRVTSDRESRAVELLRARLDDLNAWLPDRAWMDRLPTRYGGAWALTVSRAGSSPPATNLPHAAEVWLLGVRVADIGVDAGHPGCMAVPDDRIDELLAELDAVGARQVMRGVWHLDGAAVDVTVYQSLDGACAPPATGPAVSPTPTLVPSAEPTSTLPPLLEPFAELDACGFLDAATAVQLLGRYARASPDYRFGFRAPEFRTCGYVGGGRGKPVAMIWVRTSATSEPVAAALATSLFGDQVSTTSVGGDPAWMNGCDPASRACAPALAILHETYFVVLAMPGGDTTAARLLAVADALQFGSDEPTR